MIKTDTKTLQKETEQVCNLKTELNNLRTVLQAINSI